MWDEAPAARDANMYAALGAHAVHKLGVFSRVFLVCLLAWEHRDRA